MSWCSGGSTRHFTARDNIHNEAACAEGRAWLLPARHSQLSSAFTPEPHKRLKPQSPGDLEGPALRRLGWLGCPPATATCQTSPGMQACCPAAGLMSYCCIVGMAVTDQACCVWGQVAKPLNSTHLCLTPGALHQRTAQSRVHSLRLGTCNSSLLSGACKALNYQVIGRCQP